MVKTPEFSPVSGTGPTGQPNKFQTQTNPGKPYSSRQYKPQVSPRSAPNFGKNFRDSFFDSLFRRFSSSGNGNGGPDDGPSSEFDNLEICENKPKPEFDQNKLQTPSSSKTKRKKGAKGDKNKKQVAVFTYDKALEKYYHVDVYNLLFPKNFDLKKL